MRGLNLDLYLCLTFQGKFYLLIEELSQLFRALVPIQLWYKYIMGEDPSSSYFLGATLIIIYSLCKVVYLILPFPCNVNADVILLLCFFFNLFYLLDSFVAVLYFSNLLKKDLYVYEINFMWYCTSEPFKMYFSGLIIQAIFSVRVCVCVALNLQFCSVSVI